MHVLVIDDDAATRELVATQLRASRFRVSLAENGLDALMQLERVRPDLIVSEIRMPKLDGLSFVRAIKTRTDTHSIPVIFLTCETDSEVVIKGINIGARFYLTKPFDARDLVWKIRRILDR